MKQQVIYKIINALNGKFYVGSTCNTYERFRCHRKRLRAGKHHAKHLQASWNKYGEDVFVFKVIEVIPLGESLQAAEDVWLTEWVGKPECYNTSRYSDAPMRGIKKEDHPNFGRKLTEEAKQNLSNKVKKLYEDPEYQPRVGRTHSAESLARISAGRIGKHAGDKHYRFGQILSSEVRAKISATQKGRPNKMKGLKLSEQGRANIAAAVKRGVESHFYGKRPVNADELEKPILAIKPDHTTENYKSLTAMRATLGITLPTIIRACRSGNPVKFGTYAGWILSYAESPNEAPVIPDEYMALPRTRAAAQAIGAKEYFTGVPCAKGHIAPRVTKGECTVCRRESWKVNNEKNKSKPKSEAAKAAGRRYYEKNREKILAKPHT